MRITECKSEPYKNSITPAIKFELKIEYPRDHALIFVSGFLKDLRGNLIGNLEQIPQSWEYFEISSRDTEFSSDYSSCKLELISRLDWKALDHLENIRSRHESKDLELELELGLGLIRSSTSKLLELMWVKLTYIHVIKSNDWALKYAPELGLGKYHLLEIPIEPIPALQRAWEYLEKAERAFRDWDDKSVFANCREIGTLLNNLIDDLVKQSKLDKFQKEKWNRAYAGFSHQASLDLHIEDLRQSQEYRSLELKVDRRDCEQLIMRAKLLIKYASELIRCQRL